MIELNSVRQSTHQQRFGDTGNTFQQHVATREKRNEQSVRGVALTDDRVGRGAADSAEAGTQFVVDVRQLVVLGQAVNKRRRGLRAGLLSARLGVRLGGSRCRGGACGGRHRTGRLCAGLVRAGLVLRHVRDGSAGVVLVCHSRLSSSLMA